MITRKCLQCGNFTDNSEVCLVCNTPFVTEYVVKEKVKQEYIHRVSIPKEELKIVVFFNNLKTHQFIPIRILGHILYSVFMVLFLIASAISYLIAMIAA